MSEIEPISTQSEVFVSQDLQPRKGHLAQFVEKHRRWVRRGLATLTVGMLGMPAQGAFAQESQPQTLAALTSPEAPESEATLNDTLVEGFSADFETVTFPDQGIVIAQSVVNMRSEPTTAEQNVIDQLASGDIANVLGVEDGTWVQIQKVLPEGQEKDETTGYSVTTLENGTVLLERVSHDELADDPTIIPAELMHHYVTTRTLEIDSSSRLDLNTAFENSTGGTDTDEEAIAHVFDLEVYDAPRITLVNGKAQRVTVKESEITKPQTLERAAKRLFSIAAISSDQATEDPSIINLALRGGLTDNTVNTLFQRTGNTVDMTFLSGGILIAGQIELDTERTIIPGSMKIGKLSPGGLLKSNNDDAEKTQAQLDALTDIGGDKLNTIIENFNQFNLVVPTENGRLFISEVSDAELEEAGITKRGEITYSVDAEGSIIATHRFNGLETTLIFSENKGWEEVVEMKSSETPIRTTLEGDQLPWELMDVKEGLFRYELFHDPTPIEQLNQLISSASFRGVDSMKISTDPTQYPFSFEVPAARTLIVDSDDKALAIQENSGVERLDSMLVWILSERFGISPQEAAGKLERGEIPKLSLPDGKSWDTQKPVQILVHEVKLNADPNDDALQGSGGLGSGYTITDDGRLQLLIQVPSLVGAQNDLPRTEMIANAMTSLAQDLGIKLFKSGNQVYGLELLKIAWTPGEGTLTSIFDTTY